MNAHTPDSHYPWTKKSGAGQYPARVGTCPMIIRQFGYGHALPAIPEIGLPEGPLRSYDDGLLLVHDFHVEIIAFGGENQYTFAGGGMQDGSLHCALVQSRSTGPSK